MSTTHQVDGVSSAISQLASQYNTAPEPTQNGISHAPGKYTVVLNGISTREVPREEGAPLIFVTLETEVVEPANTAAVGQLPNGRAEFGNELKIETNVGGDRSDIGLKVLKGYARAMGVNTGSLEGDLAAIAAKSGQLFEITVKHKPNKEKTQTYFQVFINRELSQ